MRNLTNRSNFTPGGRYRHINTLDVDLEILRIRYKGPKYIRADVAYINRNWQAGEFLILTEKNVVILRECWDKFERIK